MPKVSIVVPIHDMKNGAFFLWRCINSIMGQTFLDYEIIITKEGSMPVNTNAGIRKAKGEWVKILYMDDFFSDDFCLESMIRHADTRNWLIFGSNDNQKPYWTDDLEKGNNHLGSPSVLMFKNLFKDNVLFDEKLSWLLDCDLYKRLGEKYGEPTTVPGNYITIGKHDGQMTNLMTDDYKLSEHEYMRKKYE